MNRIVTESKLNEMTGMSYYESQLLSYTCSSREE